jgi:ribosomal protein L37AE/L43A
MEKCERCEKIKRDVFRRAEHGLVVCTQCHQEIMRSGSQSGLVRIPRDLYKGEESPSSED